MFNLLASNPTAMLVATIGFWNITVIVGEGETGVVTRGDTIVRYIDPGASYHVPFLERVVKLPTNAQRQPGGYWQQASKLSNGSTCDLSIGYSYNVVDIDHAIDALEYGRIRHLKPTLFEARLEEVIDDLFGQISVADLDRDFESEFERRLLDRVNITYADGTKPLHLYISSFECADPDANKAIEIYRRPDFAPGPARPFKSLTGCGEIDGSATKLEMRPFSAFTADKRMVDVTGLVFHYRLTDGANEVSDPIAIQAYADIELYKALGDTATSDVEHFNLCSVIVNNQNLNNILARYGAELVALSTDTPQYAIYEPIEYPDDPAD